MMQMLPPAESEIVNAMLSLDYETAKKMHDRFDAPAFRELAPRFGTWLRDCLAALVEHHEQQTDVVELPSMSFWHLSDSDMSDALLVALAQTQAIGVDERHQEFAEVLLRATATAAATRLAGDTGGPGLSSN